jgi:hypothetical protein
VPESCAATYAEQASGTSGVRLKRLTCVALSSLLYLLFLEHTAKCGILTARQGVYAASGKT